MNLGCDYRLEYVASERGGHRWHQNTELSIAKDDWNHHVLVLGNSAKKVTFQLEKNIKKIHTSFIREGKATISLLTPMTNIFIRQAQEPHLGPFIKLLLHLQKNPHDDIEEVAEKWGYVKRVEEKADSDSDDSRSQADEVPEDE